MYLLCILHKCASTLLAILAQSIVQTRVQGLADLLGTDETAPWHKRDTSRARSARFEPDMPKKSRKCLLGEPKSLQKVSGTVRKDSFDTFWRLSGDFPRLFPRLFGDFSGLWGLRPFILRRPNFHFGGTLDDASYGICLFYTL